MKNAWKIIIILLLVSSVVAVVWLKKAENSSEQPQTATVRTPETSQPQINTKDSDNGSLVMTIEVVEPKKAAAAG